MKQANQFLRDMLDLELPEAAGDVIWRACRPTDAECRGGAIFLTVPFEALLQGGKTLPNPGQARLSFTVRFTAYGDAAVRISVAFTGELPGDDSPMLEWDSSLKLEALSLTKSESEWRGVDTHGNTRFLLNLKQPPIKPWVPGDGMPPPAESFPIQILPDGKTSVPFMAYDTFFPMCTESLALAFIERQGQPHRSAFSFHAQPNEHFTGTGERFARMDLAGRTMLLENADALGVNNRRCYKNIPFVLSSRPYGLFVHTHDHLRLSLADVSTRAVQGVVERPELDLFVIGGKTPERILWNYRRITGFPPEVPLWSYGTWMSRMSYNTAAEVEEVARRLRDGRFPCDIMHVDVGWFEEDWVCDWKFSPKKFPDPDAMIAHLREKGFRLSLWQLPHVARQCALHAEALAKGYIKFSERTGKMSESIFSGLEYVSTIDFTNPEAVKWYKEELLAPLLRRGVAAIKTDFGEHIHMDVDYHTLPGPRLHNLFPILYQKAAYDIMNQIRGEALLFARSAWAGAQRYPLHWGGDCAGSWDGLIGSLRGGLHFGLSGFAFWTCDIPGFHGVPNFMNNWPPDDVYVRWTQAATFLSHLRYHGAQPREPYEYPAIADIVRSWLNLRYALIPYLVDQARLSTRSGYPLMRALLLHHSDDRQCWHIDDQFYCGESLMIAPILNSEGVRDVYLPPGEWVDVWSGKIFTGPQWLKNVSMPLERIPLYAVRDSAIPVYPHSVQSTDEMDLKRGATLAFDASYKGLKNSILGHLTGNL